MPESFDMRLARLADAVCELPGGEAAARDLLALAADVDDHVRQLWDRRYEQEAGMFRQWNGFLNDSLAAAHAYHAEDLVIERRRIARLIAADERWSGGYAGALALVQKEDT